MLKNTLHGLKVAPHRWGIKCDTTLKGAVVTHEDKSAKFGAVCQCERSLEMVQGKTIVG